MYIFGVSVRVPCTIYISNAAISHLMCVDCVIVMWLFRFHSFRQIRVQTRHIQFRLPLAKKKSVYVSLREYFQMTFFGEVRHTPKKNIIQYLVELFSRYFSCAFCVLQFRLSLVCYFNDFILLSESDNGVCVPRSSSNVRIAVFLLRSSISIFPLLFSFTLILYLVKCCVRARIFQISVWHFIWQTAQIKKKKKKKCIVDA